MAEPLGTLTKDTGFRKGVYSLDGEPNGSVSRHAALNIMFHPDGSQAFHVADYYWGGRSPLITTFGTRSHRLEDQLHAYRPLADRDPGTYNFDSPNLRSSAAILRGDGRQMLLLSADHLMVADLTQEDVVDRGAVVRNLELTAGSEFAWSDDGSILVGIRYRNYDWNLRAIDLRPDEPVVAWEVSKWGALEVDRMKSLTGLPQLDLVAALGEGSGQQC